MNLIGMFKKTIRRLQVALFPTKQNKEVMRYFADGGDDAFRFDFDLNDESLVLDLGGFQGQWASDIYSRYKCRILVFEPVKMFADKISERFKNNTAIEVFCIALGAKKRKEIIGLCQDGSSTFNKAATKETIEFEDVKDFLVDHNIKDIDLIKINIEGGEYELLTRLVETGLIKNIKQMQIQFHDVGQDSELQMRKICSELTKTHRPTFQYKFVWENWVRNDV